MKEEYLTSTSIDIFSSLSVRSTTSIPFRVSLVFRHLLHALNANVHGVFLDEVFGQCIVGNDVHVQFRGPVREIKIWGEHMRFAQALQVSLLSNLQLTYQKNCIVSQTPDVSSCRRRRSP